MKCPYCGFEHAIAVDKDLCYCGLCGGYFRGERPYDVRALSKSEIAERLARNIPIATAKVSQVALPQEPDFLEFLQVLGDMGGPSSPEEFLRMPDYQREYFLNAYKIWLKKYEKGKKLEGELKGRS